MPKNSEHVALYRKYRPQEFKDVIGQDHIVKVVEGAVKLGHISHAYLFAGSRGTGKTSLARILARSIGTVPEDVYEIDAASNTGVDDIRALNESVNTLPYRSKYKVYIVDEVHMLSKSAFNALLKTLEEPPAHVIFILATTEMEKLPETVISRCQNFVFKKPSRAVLKELVQRVAKTEGYSLEPASAELVALLGDGSFRDTLGILDKVTSFSADKKISRGEVETVTGAPKRELVNACAEAIDAGDAAAALKAIEVAAKAGVEMKLFLTLLLEKVRSVLLLRFAPEVKRDLIEDFGEEDVAFLERLAKHKDSRISSKSIVELLEAHSRTSYAAVPELPAELAVLSLLEPR